MPATSPPLDVALPRARAERVSPDGTEEFPSSLGLHCLELNLPRVTLEELDRASRGLDGSGLDGRVPSADTEEVTLLSTCHRVELYLVVRSPLELDRWFENLPVDRRSWTLRSGHEVVRHLFRVAAGLESMVPGEAEIRHQVRAAGRAGRATSPRPVLRELFGRAAQAADLVLPPGGPSRSVASVAAEKLVERFASSRPRVVVVGAGMAGKRVVESLAPSAELCVVYHDRPPAPVLLQKTRARTAPLARLGAELENADALVCASRSPAYCLGPADLPAGRSLIVVDLGVPRNIDPAVRRSPGIELWDLEDLWPTGRAQPRPEYDEGALEDLADSCAARLDTLLLEPWIAAVRRRAETLRADALAKARPFLGPLTPAQEAAVDRLTRTLVAQLLQAPSERLRELPPGPDGERLRRFALELLRPPPGS